eukprot:COSAG02_NODE_1600_length_11742_cov_33.722838_11_plen_61_part_00
MQNHTRLWLIATLISLGMGVVSDTVKVVAISIVLKHFERFSDVGEEIIHAIAGELESNDL